MRVKFIVLFMYMIMFMFMIMIMYMTINEIVFMYSTSWYMDMVMIVVTSYFD